LTGFAVANPPASGNTLGNINPENNTNLSENINSPTKPDNLIRQNENKSNNNTKKNTGGIYKGDGGSWGSGSNSGGDYINPPDTTSPNTTLNYPNDDFIGNLTDPMMIDFICSAKDNFALSNISLYITDSNGKNFTLYGSKVTSGISNSTSWLLDLGNGIYSWNCLTYDASANLNWGELNRTLIINHTNINNSDSNYGLNVYSNSPDDSVERIDGNINFSCTAKGSNLSSLNLILNGVINKTYSITGETNHSDFIYYLQKGVYSWQCLGYDGQGNYNVSAPRILAINPLVIPKSTKYGGGTTNWSKVSNIKKVCNAVLDNPGSAKIKWNGCINAESVDFDKYVTIGYNYIEVNSSFLDSSFNSSAELTMEYLPWKTTPAIYKNGKICNTCKVIDYKDGILRFNVTSFSSYTTGPNTKLEIWDGTDSIMPYSNKTIYPNENLDFFANYSDIMNSLPITTGTCTIYFADNSIAMTYNSTNKLFEYTRTFGNSGIYVYNITCSDSSYETLNSHDSLKIGQLLLNGPNGAKVSEINTSSSQPDAPSDVYSDAGNLTEIILSGFSNTNSWQGYYGNVSGVIFLADSLGHVMYNWSAENAIGEVFSSTSDLISWGDIKCFDMDSQTSENKTVLESAYGINSSDPDGIDETFNLNSHPQFFVGKIGFSPGICKNTKVYGPDGSGIFDEVLLYDSKTDNVVYTSILKDNTPGFDKSQHDFEMMVLENGHGTNKIPTNYFFYIELGS